MLLNSIILFYVVLHEINESYYIILYYILFISYDVIFF